LDVTEVIPNASTLAFNVKGAFYLVGSSSYTPSEVVWVHVESASNEVLSSLGDLDLWQSVGNALSLDVSEDSAPFSVYNVQEAIKDHILLHLISNDVGETAHNSDYSGDLGVPGGHGRHLGA
jgi:hypothetical protein